MQRLPMWKRLSWAHLICVVMLVGCGQAKPAAVTPSSQSEVKPTSTKAEQTKPIVSTIVESTELVTTADVSTPEGAFRQTLLAFQEGRLDAAYDFLPETFQADVQNLVHLFGDKMDAELWSKLFMLLNKVSNILATKKSLIFGLDNVRNSAQFTSVKPHWDLIAGRMHELANSEVAQIANLKTIDVREVLVVLSKSLAGVPLPKFSDVSVRTVKVDGDTAVLAYRESADAEPREVEFVKVDGKWLPKSIASGWAGVMADTKEKLVAAAGQISAVKPTAMQKLDELAGMLDQVQQAKTAEEFSRAIVPLIFAFKFGALIAQQALQDLSMRPRPGVALHIVIDRELSDAEQTRLKNAVIESSGGADIDYEMIPTDGKTRCRFSPIGDVDAVVAKMKQQFAEGSIRWDAATKTIRVQLK